MQAMHMLDHVMLIDTMHITSYIIYNYTTLHYYGPMHIITPCVPLQLIDLELLFFLLHILCYVCYVMLFILERPIEQRL